MGQSYMWSVVDRNIVIQHNCITPSKIMKHIPKLKYTKTCNYVHNI